MTSVDAHALLAQAAALRAQGKLHDAIAIYIDERVVGTLTEMATDGSFKT